MHFRQKFIIEWLTSVPLTSGETRIVEVGNVTSTRLYADCRGCEFITFGVISSHTFDFEIQGDVLPSFATVDTLLTLPCLAATYSTPYDLPAVMNETGWVVVTRPIIRIRLIDTATANHDYTRVYVKAWG